MNIANIITCGRIGLAPILVGLAWRGHERAFLFGLIAALISDIADGQLARRCHLATPLGAKLDSWADFLTALVLPFAIYWLRPDLISTLRIAFIVAVLSYLLPITVGFLKFRSLTSYHTFLARVSAYLLGAAIVMLFARGPTLPFEIAVAVLGLSAIEELAITLLLGSPRSNVGSLRNLLRGKTPP
jgi:phosphatidylglycerophosphate synthase